MVDDITDVAGVRVGHVTPETGSGVTVVVPPGEQTTYPWGCRIIGDPGVITGLAVLEDFGFMGSPVFLTGLMSAGRIYNGALTHAFSLDTGLPIGSGWPPIVIGVEDGRRVRNLKEEHALEAMQAAVAAPRPQGRVGAGAGAIAYGMRGGIGCAARWVEGACIVGILTLAAHGRRQDLVVRGARMEARLRDIPIRDNPAPCAVSVIATDAPLGPRMLDRLCGSVARGWVDLGWSEGDSGVAIAFSTGTASRVPPGLGHAARAAAAESVLNAVRHGEERLNRVLEE